MLTIPYTTVYCPPMTFSYYNTSGSISQYLLLIMMSLADVSPRETLHGSPPRDVASVQQGEPWSITRKIGKSRVCGRFTLVQKYKKTIKNSALFNIDKYCVVF